MFVLFLFVLGDAQRADNQLRLLCSGWSFQRLCMYSYANSQNSVSEGYVIVRKLPWIIGYCFILINEIIKANLTMIHYLLSPQILPEPALVRFHTDLKTRTAQVLLANSITLTPGTITVEMKDGEYLIHCYDKTMGEGLDSSVFVSMLKKLEE